MKIKKSKLLFCELDFQIPLEALGGQTIVHCSKTSSQY